MNSDLKDRTKKFSLAVIDFYNILPKGMVFHVLGKQLLRSGTSVGANTRSAFRGGSTKEFIAKIGIVIEEADESIFWCELLEEQKEILKTDELKWLKKEADEIVAIFTSISKNSKK